MPPEPSAPGISPNRSNRSRIHFFMHQTRPAALKAPQTLAFRRIVTGKSESK